MYKMLIYKKIFFLKYILKSFNIDNIVINIVTMECLLYSLILSDEVY